MTWEAKVDRQRLHEVMLAYRAQTKPRVPCTPPLTSTQIAVISLLADGFKVDDIASQLKIVRSTVQFHIYTAAQRIPGDLLPSARVVAWFRGATLEVLAPAGTQLKKSQ